MAAPMVQVNVRVEPRLYEKVKTQAKRDRVTVTELVNRALTAHVTGDTTK